MSRRPLVAGNWKMNGLRKDTEEIQKLMAELKATPAGDVDVMLCPPFTLLMGLAKSFEEAGLVLGAQDCHVNVSGAHTGDISAEMIADAGARAIIVGHSERRADHGETDALVKTKAEAAYRAGVAAIICIGETQGQRNAGLTLMVNERQLKNSLPSQATAANTVIAYEPVWAIGTGLTPTAADVAEVHASIRQTLTGLVGKAEADNMRVLYGGSVKPDNAKELMAVENVDGALVGGASLKAEDFLGIIRNGYGS